MFLVPLFLISVSAETTTPTTTKSYELEVKGANPIRIIEGEPLWKTATTTTATPKNIFQHRSYNTYPNDRYSSEENSEEYQVDSLQDFLNSYQEKLKKKHNNRGNYETVELITKPTIDRLANIYLNKDTMNDEKPKSWDLMHYQKHHHPYDDKKGWVSMDPVPWSISKISKWQNNRKNEQSQRPSYDSVQQQQQRPSYGSGQQQQRPNYDFVPQQQQRPSYDSAPQPQRPSYDSDEDYSDSYPKPWNKPYRPSYDSVTIKPNGYEGYHMDKQPTSRPSYSKPTAIFGHKVQIDYSTKPHYQHHNHPPYKHDENCDNSQNDGIITDGLPPNFPEIDNYRRRVSDNIPSHPLLGDGDWVLLSTTKGYKYPQQRQRALQLNPQSIGTHRGVRLTVLPPLKNSKVNMTTSHGGLLQVESTFQTVEQAKNQFMKKQRNKTKPKRKVRKQNLTQEPEQQKYQQLMATPVTSAKKTAPDASSVLAAVGAGMIPATMAMLVPMAMGGRRRRDLNDNSKIKMRLPRSI